MRYFNVNLYPRGKNNLKKKLLNFKLSKILKIILIFSILLIVLYIGLLFKLYSDKKVLDRMYNKMKYSKEIKTITQIEKNNILNLLNIASKKNNLDRFLQLIRIKKPNRFRLIKMNGSRAGDYLNFELEISTEIESKSEIEEIESMFSNIFLNNELDLKFSDTSLKKLQLTKGKLFVFSFSGKLNLYE